MKREKGELGREKRKKGETERLGRKRGNGREIRESKLVKGNRNEAMGEEK